MSDAPTFHIDLAAFHADPYPMLAQMRAQSPICFVPEINATLITRRDDIHHHEKQTQFVSALQPNGPMVVLMGQNLMRKEGEAHLTERKAIFPALSPRTVRDHWMALFTDLAIDLLRDLKPRKSCNLVEDYAKPLSGMALAAITGLTEMGWQELDDASQAMIDGLGNFAGDAAITERCHAATARIDAHIEARLDAVQSTPDHSMLCSQLQAGLPLEAIKANIRLAISGGQNEPRDAIAGAAWALMQHPDQAALIDGGTVTYRMAFQEFTRWIAPICMSTRRIAQPYEMGGFDMAVDDKILLMYGSANRDEQIFDAGDQFQITRDTSKAVTFGAGPHFCAGAAVSQALVADVALPLLFDSLPNLRLQSDDTVFEGWAFRGPKSVLVAWD